MKRDTRRWVGGRAGRCAVPLMEMDVGSELSPEQPSQQRKREEIHFLVLPPRLQNSFNERGGAEHSRLDLTEEGETAG